MKHTLSLVHFCLLTVDFYISIVLIVRRSVFNEAVLNKSQLEKHSNAYKSILIVSIQVDCCNFLHLLIRVVVSYLSFFFFFYILNAAASFV